MSAGRGTAMPVRYLSDAPTNPGRGAFVALVPGEAAPLYRLDLPPKLRAGVRQRIARSQLESLLHEDLGSLDIRIAGPDGDGALVVDDAMARGWRAALGRQRGQVRALLPDYMALPVEPGCWVLDSAPTKTDPPRVRVRMGPSEGFSAPQPHALAQLRRALSGDDAPAKVIFLGALPDDLRQMFEQADMTIEQRPAGPQSARFDYGELSFDLLRDPAAERLDIKRSVQRWTLPLVLLFAGILGFGGAVRLETNALATAAQSNADAARSVARQAFIPNGPILNLRQQVGLVIAERQKTQVTPQTQADPLDLLHTAVQALAKDGVDVRKLQKSPTSPLVADLAVPDFAALERVVQGLNAAGTQASVVSSSVNGTDGVAALVEIRPEEQGQK